MHSIRRKLLFTLLAALLAAGFSAAAATFFSAQAEFNEFLDAHLRETAESLAASARDSMPFEAPTHLTIVGDTPSYRIIVQVYDSENNSLWQRENTPMMPLPEGPGFSLTQVEGKNWRTYSVAAGPLVITVGQDMRIRTSLAATAAFRILQPLLLLLPFIAIAVWIVVGSGLAPLEKTARSVARRSPTSLEPLSTKGLPTELAALVTAVNDLLKRLAESLSAQQRFASDAAHELRTPLTALKLQVQLAQRAKTPEAQQKCFARLNEGINRATRLVQQLLTIARLDPDASKKPMTTINLAELIESVREDMTPIAAQKRITITAAPGAASIDGMEDAIRLMVTNLTDNAIRYTPEDGRIELSTASENGLSVVRVSDNGPGIAPEERERVFDRFYRALGTKTSGTGLGLAIVKRIVDIHHGTIRIEDGLDGRGTTFRLEFPPLGASLPRQN
ncbi:HAMP domain-containing sensor histidine kinase [Sutterella sp.]|uniref:sensor histidine kinase n=1 Tax=Sutterella sp. TaxID=1981025 RepID=UPI0026E0039B|nr:ATP-binding protein [Sutterella sp.]MDO5530470.1 ATP-binding protein [Sutterella sp.]